MGSGISPTSFPLNRNFFVSSLKWREPHMNPSHERPCLQAHASHHGWRQAKDHWSVPLHPRGDCQESCDGHEAQGSKAGHEEGIGFWGEDNQDLSDTVVKYWNSSESININNNLVNNNLWSLIIIMKYLLFYILISKIKYDNNICAFNLIFQIASPHSNANISAYSYWFWKILDIFEKRIKRAV